MQKKKDRKKNLAARATAQTSTTMAGAEVNSKGRKLLIEIFLPVKQDAQDGATPAYLQALQKRYTQKFGGVTIYDRSPATGLWQPEESVCRDTIIIYEVITDHFDLSYWQEEKLHLQKDLEQSQILIRYSTITIV
jgi:inorganic pyrophosphatase